MDPDARRYAEAILDDPHEQVGRLSFADWLDDRPDSVPNAEAWAKCFRQWTPESAAVWGVTVDPETRVLFDAIITGTKKQFVSCCIFENFSGDGLVVPASMEVVDSIFRDNGGYGASLGGGIVAGCTAINNTSGGWTFDGGGSQMFIKLPGQG